MLLELFANVVPIELENIPTAEIAEDPLLPPLDPWHEVWASKATYPERSEARKVEAGVEQAYNKGYDAERPELFFKAVGWRAVGHDQLVRTRGDSSWSVPQPELVLVVNQHQEIVGYAAGNDMVSRDIEDENPVHLSQARIYDDSCSVGPGILIADPDSLRNLPVELLIERDGTVIFRDSTRTSLMTWRFEELVAYLGQELDFPDGTLLMTGTGIVPPDDLTLQPADKIKIIVGELTLVNEVALPGLGARISGWNSLLNGYRYRTVR
ncbi:MAG: fumarylacetoacetate hydrolase family protein [Rubrobacteraceae bacterium]